MRIDYLHIGRAKTLKVQNEQVAFLNVAPDPPEEPALGFKSLRDFEINFEDEQADKFRPTVIVGENGTGKTNLLEALVTIFRDLDLDDRTEFAYTIKYECRKRTIQISSHPKRSLAIILREEDGKEVKITLAKFRQRKEELLPRHVFCYYSGNNLRLERLFFKHQQKHYQNSTTKYKDLTVEERKDLELQRFFYAKTVHSKFVLLSFFTEKDEKVHEFLRETFGITGLESVLFLLRKPSWAKAKSNAKGKEGERFWRSDGLVRQFLNHLYEHSLAPLELPGVPIERDFYGAEKEDLLCLYLENQGRLQALTAEHYPTQRQFFDALQSTYISDLLEDVQILLESNRSDAPVSFAELSEGEQQLLTVFGLLRFTKQDDSLILLDEPDTHVNPVWGWKYFEMLGKAVEKAERSHFIMVTHDPLVISGLERQQVQILRRSPDGDVQAEQPEDSPKGMGFSDILTGEMFGLRAAVDKETLELLDRKRELAVKPDLTPAERRELGELREKTRDLELDHDERDPELMRFVMATREQPLYAILNSSDVVSKDDIEELKRLARETIERLNATPQLREGPR
jgi:predicted ATPase